MAMTVNTTIQDYRLPIEERAYTPVGTSVVRSDGDLEAWPVLRSVQIMAFPEGTPIPGTGLMLGFEVHVVLEMTRDGLTLRSGALDEEAFGATPEEVYVDFLTSLRDRYNSLARREGRLSREDSQILRDLRGLLIERSH
jgi:hypothetical protein